MRAFNSYIRIKEGCCSHLGCTYKGPLTKGKCQRHYWYGVKLSSIARLEEKELQQNESLSNVIEDLDSIFSQYIRLKESDDNGYVICYCGSVIHWTEADNSHYIPRAHMNTRFLEDNCKSSCRHCNRNLSGNLSVYGNYLENKRAGSVDALEQQSLVAYNYGTSELKELISYYSRQVSKMKKTKPQKI